MVLKKPCFPLSPIPVSEEHSHITLPIPQRHKNERCNSSCEHKGICRDGAITYLFFQCCITKINKLGNLGSLRKSQRLQKLLKHLNTNIFEFLKAYCLCPPITSCLSTFSSLNKYV